MQRKPTPEEFLSQFPLIKEMLKTMQIKTIEESGIEADDIIGSISNLCDCDKIILSGDKDLLQLIDQNTSIWLTKKGVSEVDKVDINNIQSKFQISPKQVIDLKALMGDVSDNIPGVKGIGEKTAIELIGQYSDLNNLYNHLDNLRPKLKEKLVSDKDMAYLSKQLATIKTDCKIDFNLEECKVVFPFTKNVYAFFSEMDFTSLLNNKSLFSEDLSQNDIPLYKKIKLTKENIAKFKDYTNDIFCYNLQSLEFLFQNNIYFLEQTFDIFSDRLDIDEVMLALKPIFENEKILKITSS